MIKVVSKIMIDLIREREYAGKDEFIGTYKIGASYPVPFRLIQNRHTKELTFQPQISLLNTAHITIIKIEVLRQSAG